MLRIRKSTIVEVLKLEEGEEVKKMELKELHLYLPDTFLLLLLLLLLYKRYLCRFSFEKHVREAYKASLV